MAWKKLAIPLCRPVSSAFLAMRAAVGGFPCNSQGEELKDEIQRELPVAASDAEHGNWRNCGPINQRLKQSIREIGGRSNVASMADRGKVRTRGGAN